ncbi:glutamate--tRNA ligase, partial [Halobacteriales archaeon QH_10_65_19]
DYFGWEYPEVIHWGHVQIDEYDVALSTSTIAELVDSDELDGWDDPRAPTVASLRRRGIRGEAIVEAMIELGTSTSNVDLATSAIYSHNRALIDDGTDRAFLVRDDSDQGGGAVESAVRGGPEAGRPPVHPEHEDRGRRQLSVEDGVLVEASDLPPEGDRVWLKGYGCVRRTSEGLEWVDADIDVTREEGVDIVHWVPAGDAVPLRLRTMDGDVHGHAEPGVAGYDPDEMLQFERVGFARIDAHEDVETVAYFAHR